MAFTNFDPVIQAACQDGILIPGFKANLSGRRAFTYFTTPHKFKGSIGIKQTFTKNVALPVSDLTPRNASDITSNSNNGMTMRKSTLEQYEITLNEWDDAAQVDIQQEEALIASEFVKELGNLGESAYAKKEFLVRKAYLDTYLGGNSRVMTGGTLSGTTARVDDIRGFVKKLTAAGEIADVSGANTLLVNHYNSTGALVQQLTVTGVLADVSNASSMMGNFCGGISGQITYTSTGTVPSIGDALVAANAPRVFRAGGKLHSGAITGGDLATTDGPSAIATYLRNQGLMGVKGTNKLIALCGFSMLEQLKRDPLFQSAYNGRGNDPDIADGLITEFDGILYVPTNFVPMNVASDGTIVARALFIGANDACMEANWDGYDAFIAKKAGSSTHHYEKMESNMALVLQEATDLKGRIQKMAYSIVTDFCCGSDMGANVNNPTASTAMFKKAAWYEHAVLP